MRSSTLSLTAILGGLVLAQINTNGTNNSTCTGDWQQRYNAALGSINSTGTVPITWNSVANIDRDSVKPWYISVLVNNTNEGVDNEGTITQPFLSVPNGVGANTCVYQFGAQNATATGNVSGSIGCGGVLSEKCITYLSASLLNNTSGIHQARPSCSLPIPTDEELKRREEACGDIGGNYSSVSIGDVGNASASCSYPSLAGVALPDDYLTYQVGPSLSPYKEQVYHTDTAYNLSVVQSTPFAVVAAFEVDNIVQRDVSFVCVTPNNTQHGSYLPENKTPWTTSDAGANWRATGGLSVWIAGAVGLILAL